MISLDMEWYYVDPEGKSRGPVSLEEMAKENEGVADYYVFTEGLEEWVLASKMPEIISRMSQQGISIVKPTPTQAPSTKPRWTSDPATEKQIILLTLYGIEARQGMTKGEASDLISKMKDDGIEPTPENRARHAKLHADFEKREKKARLERDKISICDAIEQLSREDLKSDNLLSLKEKLEELLGALVEECESRAQDLEEIEQEKKNRLQEMMGLFGKNGEMGDCFKKPTKQQVEETLAELDKSRPGAFYHGEGDFVEALEKKFPHLKKG